MIRLVNICYMVVLQHVEHCESFQGIIPEIQQRLFEYICWIKPITPALVAKFDCITTIGKLLPLRIQNDLALQRPKRWSHH